MTGNILNSWTCKTISFKWEKIASLLSRKTASFFTLERLEIMISYQTRLELTSSFKPVLLLLLLCTWCHKGQLEAVIPKKWPEDIEQLILNNTKPSRKQKSEMVRIITERTLQNGLTKDDFPWVANYVISKVPLLQSSVVTGSVCTGLTFFHKIEYPFEGQRTNFQRVLVLGDLTD